MRIPHYLAPKPRPYWHVDAKWVCGLLLLFFLGASLFLAGLANLTSQKNGPRLAALVIGSVFIRDDGPQAKAEARAELAKQGGVLHPLPNIPSVTITEKDLDLSPAELKIKVFKPLTDTIYQDGVKGAADKYAKTPAEKEKFVNDATLFNVFTLSVHNALKKFSTITAALSVLFFLGVVYFSAGWGRLANPGVLLLITSLPGSLLTLAILNPPKGGGNGAALGFLPPEFGQQIGNAFSQGYGKTTVIGLLLLLAASVGKISTAIAKRSRHGRDNSGQAWQKQKDTR